MAMTVVVTRNVPDRFRGFLASCMCEVSAGVYTAPRMSTAVRGRIWSVLVSWWQHGEQASIVMTWPDAELPGGQECHSLGTPSRETVRLDGVYMARRDLTKDEIARLAKDLARAEAAGSW